MILQGATMLRSQVPSLSKSLFTSISRTSPGSTIQFSTRFTSNEALTSKNNNSNTTSTTGDYRAVELSYASFESKPREGETRKHPLVILHGLLGRKKNWKTVAKEINHLTRRTVTSADARNHGDSPHTHDMSYTLMAKDMTRLFKQLNYEKLDFMGHSMGGRVGMILALTQPQVINKLICVDTTPINSAVSNERWRTLREACFLLKEMEPQLRNQEGVSRGIMADKAVRPILPNQYDRSLFLTNLLMTKNKTPEDDLRPIWRLNIESIIANPQMASSFPDFEGVAFEGKALFVSGEYSKFVKKEHERDIKRLFPNAQIVWIPEGGHWIHTDKHREFMETVVPFLEQS